jgi:hypothetical protein
MVAKGESSSSPNNILTLRRGFAHRPYSRVPYDTLASKHRPSGPTGTRRASEGGTSTFAGPSLAPHELRRRAKPWDGSKYPIVLGTQPVP